MGGHGCVTSGGGGQGVEGLRLGNTLQASNATSDATAALVSFLPHPNRSQKTQQQPPYKPDGATPQHDATARRSSVCLHPDPIILCFYTAYQQSFLKFEVRASDGSEPPSQGPKNASTKRTKFSLSQMFVVFFWGGGGKLAEFWPLDPAGLRKRYSLRRYGDYRPQVAHGDRSLLPGMVRYR